MTTATYGQLDSICINQANVIERNYTVALMSWIFWKAAYVIAWLGDDPLTIEAAERFKSTKSAKSLAVLLRNTYFTRLWVVQEILLSSKTEVLCGHIWLSLEEMYSRVHKYHAVRETLISCGSSLNLLYDYLEKREKRHMAHLIQLYSSNECANPRDRVYALYGLLTDEEQAMLKVDYAKSVEEVFLDTLEMIVQHGHTKYVTRDVYERPPHAQTDLSQIAYTLATSMAFPDHKIVWFSQLWHNRLEYSADEFLHVIRQYLQHPAW